LDPLVNKVLEVRHETTHIFLGNVSYYLEKVEERENQEDRQHSDSPGSNGNKGLSRREERRVKAQRRQRKYNHLKPLKKKIDPLEEKIELKEARKHKIETLMAESDFYEDEEQVKEISMEYE